MSTVSQFDPARFLAHLDDDRELARELLSAFSEDAPARLAMLGQSVAAGDFEGATRAAHSLKGMCGVLKDETLTTLALGLEMSARKNNLEALNTGLPILRQAMALALGRIQEFLAEL